MKKFLKTLEFGLLTLIVVFLLYGSIAYSPTYYFTLGLRILVTMSL